MTVNLETTSGATSRLIRIGTRGSPLALRQAGMVQSALAKACPTLATEIVVIKTSGDWNPADGETRLSEAAGGKGQFAKEIEEALLAGRIDAGVHSMKDMESFLPDGLVIEHMLPREDVRDCFVFRNEFKNTRSLLDLPAGFIVGTSSVRRAAFLKSIRPDCVIVPLRGNVQTRLDKLKNGEQGMGATILAVAGLKRLGLEHEADLILEIDEMVPSAGQGAVGIEVRAEDQEALAIFSQISCSDTVKRVKSERAALAVLDGSCHTPIGAHASLKDGVLSLHAKVCSPDGAAFFEQFGSDKINTIEEAVHIGQMTGEAMLKTLPPGFLD
jgi:hydroxymethylbilane synthase